MAIKEYAAKLIEQDATLKEIAEQKETLWVNPKFLPFEMTDAVCQLVVSDADIADAEARLERFAPFIRKCFPETECTNGIIESPLKPIPEMQKGLIEATGSPISGNLFLKMDSHLAVAGSVKARGGIYEVLKHAEDLAIAAGKLKVTDNYEKLCSDEMRAFFNQYTVQVGSTGNLGLSIGISSAAIGFKVKVHMSADARQWKKDLLRSKGVEVIEYADDYSKAVAEGRKLSDADPMSYFVDDEKSVNLFLGYAVAASRLKKQLDEQGVVVDEQHPLIVYIPTGVGGAPGGVAYGLKRVYKNAVHCFFAEPTLCPSVLLGFATNLYEAVNVHDFGIDGLTEADGKARDIPVKVGKCTLFANARTMIAGTGRSFMKVVAHAQTGVLLGAQLMCEHATDMIGQLSQAIANGMTARQLLAAMRPHPTFEEALGEALEELVAKLPE